MSARSSPTTTARSSPGRRTAQRRRRSRIDQPAGIEQPGRVERLLRRAQGGGERVGALRVIPRAMVAPDAVVVGDRAARLEDRPPGGGLHLVPLRLLVAAPGG